MKPPRLYFKGAQKNNEKKKDEQNTKKTHLEVFFHIILI